jgi:hypothetical protein
MTPLGMGSNLMFIEFYCMPYYRNIFILVGMATGCISIYISTQDEYKSEKYRWVRLVGSITSGLPWMIGLVASICVVHYGTPPMYYRYLLYAVALESLAGFFYVTMLPELLYTGVFDILLPSHSIWHWINFGFDHMMMKLAYLACIELVYSGRCII